MRSLLLAAFSLIAPAIHAQRPDCKLHDLAPTCTEFGELKVEAFLPWIGGLANFTVNGTKLVKSKLTDPPFDWHFVIGWFGTVLPSPVRVDLTAGASRVCGQLAVAPTLLSTNAGAPAWVFWQLSSQRVGVQMFERLTIPLDPSLVGLELPYQGLMAFTSQKSGAFVTLLTSNYGVAKLGRP